MKNTLKYYLLAFLLVSDFILYAQPGTDEDLDPQPAPIDSKLIVLAITGLILVFYTFKKNKKVT